MEKLPKYINVTRVITFDVQDISDMIRSNFLKEDGEEVTMEEITNYISDDLSDWFVDAHKDLIWQDENGEDIDY
jgi:isoleucyl-tRNA synthetase